MTLNDLERRNGRYCALFQRIRIASGRTAYKFTFVISSPDELVFGVVTVNILNMSTNKTMLTSLREYF